MRSRASSIESRTNDATAWSDRVSQDVLRTFNPMSAEFWSEELQPSGSELIVEGLAEWCLEEEDGASGPSPIKPYIFKMLCQW